VNTYPVVLHRGIFCNQNLIDEAPLFSEDDQFGSESCTLTAHFESPPKLTFTKNDLSLVVSISLPKNATFEDPEQVENALSKLYYRVKYCTSNNDS
jgi:hypothetical protein